MVPALNVVVVMAGAGLTEMECVVLMALLATELAVTVAVTAEVTVAGAL